MSQNSIQSTTMRQRKRRVSILHLMTFSLLVRDVFCQIECPVDESICQCEESDSQRVTINCRFKNLDQIPTFSASNYPFYELTLANNNIRTVTASSWPQLNIERLDITGNELATIGQDAFESLKDNLKQLLLGGDTTILFPKEAISRITKLEYLHVEKFSVPALPNGALNPLGSLQTLILRDCGLSQLSSSALNGAQNSLVRVDLAGNQLQEVPTQALQTLTALESISINSNSLTSLSATAFSGISTIKVLDLAQNAFQSINQNAFNSFSQSLLELNLHSCQITNDRTSALRNLRSLKSLNLNTNSITSIPSDLLDSLTKLEVLELRRNNIGRLNKEMFSGPSETLLVLHLENNPISSVAPETFSEFQKLEELHMDRTQLSELELGSLDSLASSLKVLSLEETGLLSEHWQVLSPLTSLHTLWLSTNNLQNIPDMIFTRFSELSNLHLASNGIDQLSQWSLHGLQGSLSDLDLSSNSLETLSECAFHPDSYASLDIFKLKLADNPLQCNCSLLWLYDWLMENKENPLFHTVNWRCEDGRTFRTLERDDLECVPAVPPVECETPPTTPLPLTVSINFTTYSSIHVLWDIAPSSSLEHFSVTYNSINSSESDTLYFDALIRECLLEGLDSGNKYQICVEAVSSQVLMDNFQCIEATTQPRDEPVTEPDNSQLQIILGSVFGALAFIIILIVVILCLVNRSRSKDPDLPTALPRSGYDSKRFSRDKRRSMEVEAAMRRIETNDEDIKKKLEGFSHEEKIKILRMMTQGGSTMSVASTASSQRYLPEPPPIRGNAFGGYLNPIDMKDDFDPTKSPTEKHTYEELPEDTYEQIPEDSFI